MTTPVVSINFYLDTAMNIAFNQDGFAELKKPGSLTEILSKVVFED